MADYEISVIAGNVGQAPEKRQTPSGATVVGFTVAQPKQLKKDAAEPTWFNVAVWDAGLREMVLAQIKKGMPVTVMGKRKPDRQGQNGKTYRDIDAYRVGKTDYLFPLNREVGPAQRQTPSDEAEDDLPF